MYSIAASLRFVTVSEQVDQIETLIFVIVRPAMNLLQCHLLARAGRGGRVAVGDSRGRHEGQGLDLCVRRLAAARARLPHRPLHVSATLFLPAQYPHRYQCLSPLPSASSRLVSCLHLLSPFCSSAIVRHCTKTSSDHAALS